MIKAFAKAMLGRTAKGFAGTRAGRIWIDTMLSHAMQKTTRVTHDAVAMTFSTPNPLAKWRAETLASKEPETLRWIEGFPQGAVFWDIGANVGLFSVYAALKRQCEVWAFEPSVFNLELLGRNVHNNAIVDLVRIVPVALSNKRGFDVMNHSTTQWGGALSRFGGDSGTEAKYRMWGMTGDDLVLMPEFLQPDFIKIDVDGIEHLILEGMPNTLKKTKSVLVEVDLADRKQSDRCHHILSEAGFHLIESINSVFSGEGSSMRNQIWTRQDGATNSGKRQEKET